MRENIPLEDTDISDFCTFGEVKEILGIDLKVNPLMPRHPHPDLLDSETKEHILLKHIKPYLEFVDGEYYLSVRELKTREKNYLTIQTSLMSEMQYFLNEKIKGLKSDMNMDMIKNWYQKKEEFESQPTSKIVEDITHEQLLPHCIKYVLDFGINFIAANYICHKLCGGSENCCGHIISKNCETDTGEIKEYKARICKIPANPCLHLLEQDWPESEPLNPIPKQYSELFKPFVNGYKFKDAQ